jgi:hypothetical protein
MPFYGLGGLSYFYLAAGAPFVVQEAYFHTTEGLETLRNHIMI